MATEEKHTKGNPTNALTFTIFQSRFGPHLDWCIVFPWEDTLDKVQRSAAESMVQHLAEGTLVTPEALPIPPQPVETAFINIIQSQTHITYANTAPLYISRWHGNITLKGQITSLQVSTQEGPEGLESITTEEAIRRVTTKLREVYNLD